MVYVVLIVVGVAQLVVGRRLRQTGLLKPLGQRNRDAAILVSVLLSGFAAGTLLHNSWGYAETVAAVWGAWLIAALLALALHRLRARDQT